MRVEDIKDLKTWVKSGNNRTVEIKIGDFNDNNHFRIWCYDFDLAAGQSVELPGNIDIQKAAKVKYKEIRKDIEDKLAMLEVNNEPE